MQQNIEKMLNFLEISYQGFYCILCNAEHHKHFDHKTKIIKADSHFGLELLIISFPSLIYQHVHLVNAMRLMQMFIIGCDMKGNFDSQLLRAHHKITLQGEMKTKFDNCRKGIKKLDLRKCQFIAN